MHKSQNGCPINTNFLFWDLQNSKMVTENTTFSILMFPWLAHGHIFPFLELARSIVKRKSFRIYFCSTAINFDSIKKFIDRYSLNDSVELVELHLGSSPELPPHYHTTKNLPLNLKPTLIRSFQKSHSSFSHIVSTLTPDLVVYDFFQPWAPTIASSHGIPAVFFCTTGAMPVCVAHHQHMSREVNVLFPAIHSEDGDMLDSWNDTFEFLSANIFEGNGEFFLGNFKKSCDIAILKTTRGIERKNIDYLSSVCLKKMVPVGALISDDTNGAAENPEIIEWLNEKQRHSTVFISFGSEYFLSKLEINEIANALELCWDINFIWIIRFPTGMTISLDDALPQGFCHRVGERGMVITGWAPQAEILAHPNTGGFVSHCGWSSVTESMYFGVPVIAMPMGVDQPFNARMLAEAGCCVEVIKNRNEGYKGEEIAKTIKKVFSAENGDNLRCKARELSETMRAEKEEALDDAAEELWHICLKHNLEFVEKRRHHGL